MSWQGLGWPSRNQRVLVSPLWRWSRGEVVGALLKAAQSVVPRVSSTRTGQNLNQPSSTSQSSAWALDWGWASDIPTPSIPGTSTVCLKRPCADSELKHPTADRNKDCDLVQDAL